MLSPRRRGSAFGTFTAGHGVFWFLGSAVIGILYDVSAGVIGSAVIPTLIANAFYLPRHLLSGPAPEQVIKETAGATSLRAASAKAD